MKKILFLLTIFFSFIFNLYALNNISINNNMLIPEFNKNTKVYNVFVPSNIEIITIVVDKDDNEVITGSGSKSLKEGLNVIEIISYINDIEVERYTLNITRGNITYDKTNSNLKNLIINDYEINFNEFVYEYEIKIKTNDKLNIHYETNTPLETVTLKGDTSLKNKENIITIKVISGDKKHSSTYKIKIIKELKDNTSNKKTSLFDNKKFTSFELKLIIIVLIFLGLIISSIIFYFIFIKKKKYFRPFKQKKRP